MQSNERKDNVSLARYYKSPGIFWALIAAFFAIVAITLILYFEVNELLSGIFAIVSLFILTVVARRYNKK
ncbi:MAG TPA: hypothetical protein ENG95_06600 [Nitrospirae bacterium]|nr:hypothetical protein [Nitrospirota bacterium]